MGYKIAEKRKEQNLSQESLSRKSGVSRAIISDLETGRRTDMTIGTLRKLANALNCGIGDIFFDESSSIQDGEKGESRRKDNVL